MSTTALRKDSTQAPAAPPAATPEHGRPNRTLQTAGRVLLYVALIAVALMVLLPFAWMIATAR